MSEYEHEIDLQALFADDLPPRHDPDFDAGVMRRIARRRLVLELAWGGLMAAVSALILWALGPVLEPVVKPLGQAVLYVAPFVTVVAVALFLIHPRTALV